MSRLALVASFSICLLACGPRPRPIVDAGEDAGVEEVDAGRLRGDDPPTGWQVAVPLPTGAPMASLLGVSVTSTGDQFGQPLIAAVYEDPNGDLNFDDTRVFFTRWDGSTKAFAPPQIVEVIGGARFEHPDRQVSIARDTVTGRIAIAFIKPQNNTVRLAVSDDEGANFSLSTISQEGASATVSNPSLALEDGVLHVAWAQGTELMYRKRAGTGPFEAQSPGATVLGGRSVSLAVDSGGNPAVAFFVTASSTSADLAFWRPGGAITTIATADLLDLSPVLRRPSVTLIFVGTVPHVAYHLRKVEPAAMRDESTELWYAKATDATGATWSMPVGIPRNGSATTFHTTSWYQALAVDANGRVSVAADFSANGASTACGGPKLSRSPDGLMFSTCAPAASPAQTAGEWLTMWPHRAGKQTLIFQYNNRSNPNLAPGVVMWREP